MRQSIFAGCWLLDPCACPPALPPALLPALPLSCPSCPPCALRCSSLDSEVVEPPSFDEIRACLSDGNPSLSKKEKKQIKKLTAKLL